MSKKVAYGAMLVALAMIFSYVEVLIPFNFGIPGMKLGIANLVVVVGLFVLKPSESVCCFDDPYPAYGVPVWKRNVYPVQSGRRYSEL